MLSSHEKAENKEYDFDIEREEPSIIEDDVSLLSSVQKDGQNENNETSIEIGEAMPPDAVSIRVFI